MIEYYEIFIILKLRTLYAIFSYLISVYCENLYFKLFLNKTLYYPVILFYYVILRVL